MKMRWFGRPERPTSVVAIRANPIILVDPMASPDGARASHRLNAIISDRRRRKASGMAPREDHVQMTAEAISCLSEIVRAGQMSVHAATDTLRMIAEMEN